jgi:hypothetical protein
LNTIAAAARQRQVFFKARSGSGAVAFFFYPSRRGTFFLTHRVAAPFF